MAVHNVTKRRLEAAPTLLYMYRGDGHEHDINLIHHLGGNIFSGDPIIRDPATGFAVGVDISEMLKEFESQAELHTGKGELLYKHYIISLAPSEELSPAQWFEVVNEYLNALGYDDTTKWTAVEHRDTDNRHVHIFTCTVRGEPGGPLVRTHNDAQAGFAIMRSFEKKFGLRELASPEDNFGFHYSKVQIKAPGGREEAKCKDWSAVIRARFQSMYAEAKPRTMTELVVGLAAKGVAVKVTQNDSGAVTGISYRADQGPWIGGSKVKATRFSWQRLIEKEGICYLRARDDAALGINSGLIEFKIGVRLSKKSATGISLKKHKIRLWRNESDNSFFGEIAMYAMRLRSEDIDMVELIRAVFKFLDSLIDHSVELLRYEEMSLWYKPTLTPADYPWPAGATDALEAGTRAWRAELGTGENDLGATLQSQVAFVPTM